MVEPVEILDRIGKTIYVGCVYIILTLALAVLLMFGSANFDAVLTTSNLGTAFAIEAYLVSYISLWFFITSVCIWWIVEIWKDILISVSSYVVLIFKGATKGISEEIKKDGE